MSKDPESICRAILQNLNDGVWVTDASDRMIYFNPEMERIAGVSAAEAIGLNVVTDFGEETIRHFKRSFVKARETLTPQRYEAEVLTPAGRRSVQAGRLIPWVEEGVYAGMICTVADVTKRRAAERERDRADRRLQVAVAAANIGVWEWSPADGSYYFSAEAKRQLGYETDELVDTAEIVSLFLPEELAPLQAGLEKAFSSFEGDGTFSVELHLKHKDGSYRTILSRGEMVRDAAGEPDRFVGCHVDLTDRRRMQEQLAQADRLAAGSLLAAGVAHEINNPLTYVLYNVDGLNRELPAVVDAVGRLKEALGAEAVADLLGPVEREAVGPGVLNELGQRAEEALDGARRIRDRVRDLQTFSRADNGQAVPVSVNDVLDSALAMASNEIKFRAQLIKRYDRKLPPLLANDGKLAQVFLNLVVNAAHAIPEGHASSNQITITTGAEGDELAIEIADTGRGIAADDLPRIFDPFFTTKDQALGSGLGLAICRNIVTGLGGTICIESERGKGSLARIRLPVSEPVTPSLASSAPTPVVEQPRGRFMVVDDEPLIGRMMCRMMAGHEAVVVHSGREAQVILEGDQAFDGIVCDLMMPELSGMELYDWLAGCWPELSERMIFVTGGVFTTRARNFLSRVTNPRLEKPFEASALGEWAREQLGRRG